MSKKKTSIKYTARDFDSIKNEIIEYARRYYPNTFKDFSEAGFGSLMVDSVSYIGDVLSFYLDYQANESFLTNASEFDNVLNLAKQMGYKFKNNPSSTGIATFFILVPANSRGTEPDTRYIPVLKKGSEFSSTAGARYTLETTINFRKGDAVVARVSETTGVPTFYAIKSYGTVVSGFKEQEKLSSGEFEKYKTLELKIPGVSEIISVLDSDGNEYYEVDYLSQNTIYRAVSNRDSNTNLYAPDILKPLVVPRRFTVDYHVDKAVLQFGSGAEEDFTNESSLDPKNVSLRLHGKDYYKDDVVDPNRLVISEKMGVCPTNTELTVTYRRNDFDNVNASTNSLDTVVSPVIEFENENNLNSSILEYIRGSLEVSNESPILGDIPDMTVDEVKNRAMNFFGAQFRAVTEQDYETLCYTMPQNFGTIKRAKIVKDRDSFRKNLNMYVVGEDVDGFLSPTNSVVKNNLKTWVSKSKMINDTIDILDAKVVNLQVEFLVIGDVSRDTNEILNECLRNVKSSFSKKPEIAEDFFITEVYKILKDTEGVVDVVDVKIRNVSGGSYSSSYYDIDTNTSPDGRYIMIPDNVVYEIKFPDTDIKGAIK